MTNTCRGAGALSLFLSFACFFSLSSMAQWTGPDASNNIHNTNTGYVGVGTSTPRTNLEVGGYIHATTGISVAANTFSSNVPVNGATLTFQNAYGTFDVGSGQGWGWVFRTNLQSRLYITDALVSIPTSHVLIGKTSQANSGYILDVNGNGRFNQVVVNTSGADYVFDPGYQLPALRDLESFLIKEHHLPGIAPAAQMQEEGISLGDNQTRLLAKIEELTLYLIEENKRSAALQEKVEQLQEQNKALAAREQALKDLEQRMERLEKANK
jgi:hypothetical protein